MKALPAAPAFGTAPGLPPLPQVICICNDRSCPKVKSLGGHCLDLRFRRPGPREVIRPRPCRKHPPCRRTPAPPRPLALPTLLIHNCHRRTMARTMPPTPLSPLLHSKVATSFARVARAEGYETDMASLERIATACNGDLRQMLNLLQVPPLSPGIASHTIRIPSPVSASAHPASGRSDHAPRACLPGLSSAWFHPAPQRASRRRCSHSRPPI